MWNWLETLWFNGFITSDHSPPNSLDLSSSSPHRPAHLSNCRGAFRLPSTRPLSSSIKTIFLTNNLFNNTTLWDTPIWLLARFDSKVKFIPSIREQKGACTVPFYTLFRFHNHQRTFLTLQLCNAQRELSHADTLLHQKQSAEAAPTSRSPLSSQ